MPQLEFCCTRASQPTMSFRHAVLHPLLWKAEPAVYAQQPLELPYPPPDFRKPGNEYDWSRQSMALAKSPNSPLTDFCRQTMPVITPSTSKVPTITISADRITPYSSCRKAFSRFNIDILHAQNQRGRDPQRIATEFVGRQKTGLPAGSSFHWCFKCCPGQVMCVKWPFV